jgi:hypothetical protein
MRRRQLRSRQGFKIRNIEDLIGGGGRLVEGWLGDGLAPAKPRQREQCRRSRQAMEESPTRSRGQVFITHGAALWTL